MLLASLLHWALFTRVLAQLDRPQVDNSWPGQLGALADHVGAAPSQLRPAQDEESLRLVLLVHRHGDRTPIEFRPKDQLSAQPLWKEFGLGQLTNRGKRRLYLLGRQLRQRYEHLFAGSVDRRLVKARSSGVKRCQESSQLLLAGLLDLGLANSSDAGPLVWAPEEPLAHRWQPAGVPSAPVAQDGMLASGSRCGAAQREFERVCAGPQMRSLLANFRPERELLQQVYGGPPLDDPLGLLYAIDTLIVEEENMAQLMPASILAAMDRLRLASDGIFASFGASQRLRRLRAGLLLTDMLGQMRRASQGARPEEPDESRLRLLEYSTHDVTLAVLLATLGLWKPEQGKPDYGANLVVELHQADQRWWVKFVYQRRPPEEPMQLQLAACERLDPVHGRCLLDQLGRLMEPYLLAGGWAQWMVECENLAEWSLLDPYAAHH